MSKKDLISPEVLEQLKNLQIPAATLRRAAELAEISKAMAANHSVQEKHATMLKNLGRLVDIVEVEALVVGLVDESINKIKKMALTIDAESADKAGITTDQARKVLSYAQEYVLAAIGELAASMPEKVAEYQEDQANRVKRGAARVKLNN